MSFTPGTLIATATGEVPAGTLSAGMRLITRDNGMRPILWAGLCTLVPPPHLQPVRIGKGALGHGLPERDMTVSPGHRLLMTGERSLLYSEEGDRMVAAETLVTRPGIAPDQAATVTYLHLLLETAEMVLSDGCWSEAFAPPDRPSKADRGALRELDELFPDRPALPESRRGKARRGAG